MRAYIPISWTQLTELDGTGTLPGPLTACAVDPAWRAGDREVDEEEWEYEAQSLASQSLAGDSRGDVAEASSAAAGEPGASATGTGGVVLAVDLDPVPGTAQQDGWFVVTGGVRRRDLGAVLTADLEWFAVQEIPALLAAR